jgi:dipeptidyl aminopeptidase/acylaminoacyl peptidase
MLASGLGSNGAFDVVRLDATGAKADPLLATNYTEEAATLSRDGHWLAYLSDETGRMEVYVRPYPTGGAKTLVSQGGGAEVRWAPDGRTLYYEGQVNGVPMMIAAAASTTPEFRIVGRTPLFDVSEFEPAEPHANWDISPDGTRFAMAHQAPFHTLAVVIGWTEEVRRHAGARP